MISQLREIYSYRSVIRALVTRNLVGKYRNSFLGPLWHILNPLLLVAIYYVVFGTLMGRSTVDYWIYLMAGLFPLSFFQNNISQGATCILNNAGMIKKMYFPREIVVISQIVSSLVPTIISIAIVVITVALLSPSAISPSMLLVLPLLFLSTTFATGYALLLSIVVTFHRDLKNIVDLVSRFVFWITPVFYSISDVSGILNTIVWLNPLTYFIESFHISMCYGTVPDTMYWVVCTLISIIMIIMGTLVFEKYKARVAEVL